MFAALRISTRTAAIVLGSLIVLGVFTWVVFHPALGQADESPVAGPFSSTPSNKWIPVGTGSQPPDIRAIEATDDTLYVGGEFSGFARKAGAFLSLSESDAQITPSVPEVSGANASVNVVIPDGTGGWYIGGIFSQVGSASMQNLARIKADGSLDTNFKAEPNGPVRALVKVGNDLYVGGDFDQISTTARRGVAKLNAGTGALQSWDAKLNGPVNALAEIKGYVYAVGNFTQAGIRAKGRGAALRATTAAASSWDPNANGPIDAIAIDPLKKYVYIGGRFTALGKLGRYARAGLGAMKTSGTSVRPWDPQLANGQSAVEVYSLAMSPNKTLSASRLYVGGSFATAAGSTRNGLASLTTAAEKGAAQARPWNPGLASGAKIRGVTFGGGSVYLAGEFSTVGGANRNAVAKVDEGSGAVQSWNPDVRGGVSAVAYQPGKVGIAGTINASNFVARKNLAALVDRTGEPKAWNPNPTGVIRDLEIARNRLYVGGTFTHLAGSPRAGLAYFDLDDESLAAWNPTAVNFRDMATLDDDKNNDTMHVAADQLSYNGVSKSKAGAFALNNGSLLGWTANYASLPDTVFKKMLVHEGKLYYVVHHGARETEEDFIGSDTGWVATVRGLAREIDDVASIGNRMFIGGRFDSIITTAGTTGRNNLAAIIPNPAPTNGSSLEAWNPSPNGRVSSLAGEGETLYLGGRFNSVGNKSRKGTAALDINSSNVFAMDPNLAVEPSADTSPMPKTLHVSDDRLVVGGNFTTSDGGLQALARFENSGYMVKPEEAERTRRRVQIKARARGSLATGARFEYKRAGESSWLPIPEDRIATERNESVSYPVPLSDDGSTPTLVWDVSGTPSVNAQDGNYDVRAVFTAPEQDLVSRSRQIVLDQTARGSADATSEIGPGMVDLLTGNFSFERTDVNIAGYISSLNVSRTYNSRSPGNGVMGPGWITTVPVDEANSNYASLKYSSRQDTYECGEEEVVDENGDVIDVVVITCPYTVEEALITGSDGTEFKFVKEEGDSTWYSEAGAEDLELTRSGGDFQIRDLDGNRTVMGAQTGVPNTYVTREIHQPGSAGKTSYSFANINGKMQVLQVHAPTRSAQPCPGDVACRSLTFNYRTDGKLGSVSFTAMGTTDVVAMYEYDAQGRLSAAWDPRISPALKETYEYDSQNHLTKITPAGLEPWNVAYSSIGRDPNTGRLKSISRTALPGTATWTMRYDVATAGGGAPHNMSADEVAKWGQRAVATDATAIVPPDGSTSDSTKWSIQYQDAEAREINTIAPGGRVSTTEYDEHHNVVRELSPGNRARALQVGGAAGIELSKKIDSRSVYGRDGLDLKHTFGPEHEVKLDDGRKVRARQHTETKYDEGAPHGKAFHLPTTTIESARLADGSDVDQRFTVNEYSEQVGGTGSGWTFRKPTRVTVDNTPGGAQLKTTYVYDAQTGQERERRMPGGPGGDTAATVRTYYVGSGPSSFCQLIHDRERLTPDLGMPCATRHVVSPANGLPALTTKATKFDRLYQPSQAEKYVQNSIITTQIGYDAAGRTTSAMISGQSDELVVSTGYSPTTGLPLSTSLSDGSTTKTTTKGYDSLGRVTSYTDADGETTNTSYDLLGRVSQVSDSKSTRTPNYDPITSEVTSLSDSAAGTFTAKYDTDGQIYEETMPNGLRSNTTRNEIGTARELSYTKTGGPCGGNCTWYSDKIIESIHGQWIDRDSSLSDQEYKYDGVGRLTQVKDTTPGLGCTTRSYAFDADSNRTAQVTRGPGAGGACDTSGPGEQVLHSYDDADRITDAGYEYDAFSRITKTPARDAGGQTLEATYYANDLVKTLTQGGKTHTFQLDPNMRTRVKTTTGEDNETYHYGDDSDAPSWIADGAAWTRNISGISGNLGAIQHSTQGVTFQIGNLHGDVIATASANTQATQLIDTFENDEFGVPKPEAQPGPQSMNRYQWLGGKERETQFATGVVTMGARVYVPQMGRFLQTDPVEGASANAYDYAYQDPVNMFDLDGLDPCKRKKKCKNGIYQTTLERKLARQRRAAKRSRSTRTRSKQVNGGTLTTKRISKDALLKPLTGSDRTYACVQSSNLVNQGACHGVQIGNDTTFQEFADAACTWGVGGGGSASLLAKKLGLAIAKTAGAVVSRVGVACFGYTIYAEFKK